MKNDIAMFGEPIPTDVLHKCQLQSSRCDCILVTGTSATVFPAAAFLLEARRKGGPLIKVNLY